MADAGIGISAVVAIGSKFIERSKFTARHDVIYDKEAEKSVRLAERFDKIAKEDVDQFEVEEYAMFHSKSLQDLAEYKRAQEEYKKEEWYRDPVLKFRGRKRVREAKRKMQSSVAYEAQHVNELETYSRSVSSCSTTRGSFSSITSNLSGLDLTRDRPYRTDSCSIRATGGSPPSASMDDICEDERKDRIVSNVSNWLSEIKTTLSEEAPASPSHSDSSHSPRLPNPEEAFKPYARLASDSSSSIPKSPVMHDKDASHIDFNDYAAQDSDQLIFGPLDLELDVRCKWDPFPEINSDVKAPHNYSSFSTISQREFVPSPTNSHYDSGTSYSPVEEHNPTSLDVAGWINDPDLGTYSSSSPIPIPSPTDTTSSFVGYQDHTRFSPDPTAFCPTSSAALCPLSRSISFHEAHSLRPRVHSVMSPRDMSLHTPPWDAFSEDYVKRPENAFILFRRKCCEDRQQAGDVAAADGLTKKQRQVDLSKTISQQWKSLSAEERQFWEQMAQDKKKEHEQSYPNYVYRPQRAKDKDGQTKNKKMKKVDQDTGTHRTQPSSAHPSVRHSPLTDNSLQQRIPVCRPLLSSGQQSQSSSAPSFSEARAPVSSRTYSSRADSVSVSDDRDATVKRKKRTPEEETPTIALKVNDSPLESVLRLPKLAPSAWQLYFTDWIQKQQASGRRKLNVAQVAKEAGQEYACLSPAEKEPYNRRSQATKEARERENKAYMRTLTPEDIKRENLFRAAQRKAGKSRKSNKTTDKRGGIKDPNAPKKPLSAYFMFLQRIRASPRLVAEIFGDETEPTKQSVLAAAKWRSMTDAERQPFFAQAEKEKTEYDAARRIYEDGTTGFTSSILPGSSDFPIIKTESETENEEDFTADDDDERSAR